MSDPTTQKKKVLKGLVEPQFISKAPLDLLFNQLQDLLKFNNDLDDIDKVNLLHKRLTAIDETPEEQNTEAIATVSGLQLSLDDVKLNIPANLSPAKSDQEDFSIRYSVIEALLNKLIQIKELAIMAKPKFKNKDTVMISLHDMRTFGSLVNFIILEGVYSALPSNIGISLEKRRLAEFRKNEKSFKKLQIKRIKAPQLQFKLLTLIINKFLAVFDNGTADGGGVSPENNNDVGALLLKGVGYSDLIISAIYLIYNPTIVKSSAIEKKWQSVFDKIENISSAFELFELYSLLVNPSNVEPWFRKVCLNKITFLPLRRKNSGVLTLIEFLTGMRYNEEINIEKYDYVNRILLNKPRTISTIDYFNNISFQMYNILILINRPMLTSVCVNFIEALYAKNPLIVKDFYLRKIWIRCNPSLNPKFDAKNYNDGDLLVAGKDYNNVINVIFSILKNNSSKELLNVLFDNQIVLSLWNYLVFLQNKKLVKNVEFVKNIFKLYFTSTASLKSLLSILDNLLIGLNNYPWAFDLEFLEQTVDNKEVIVQHVGIKYQSIKTKEFKLGNISKEKVFDSINLSTDLLIDLIEDLDETLIQKLFLVVLKKWLLNDDCGDNKKPEKSLLLLEADQEDNKIVESFKILTNLRLLQSMSVKFKNQINNNDNVLEILEILETVLKNFKSSLLLQEQQQSNNANPQKVSEDKNGIKEDDETDSDDEVDDLDREINQLLIFNNDDNNDNNNDTVLNIAFELLASILSANSAFKLIDVEVVARLQRISRELEDISKQFSPGEKLSVSLNDSIKNLQDEIIEIIQVNDKFEKNLLNNDNVDGSAGLSKKETLIKLNKIQQEYEFDMKLYDKAIKNLNDKIVPIKAHGLQLVNELVIKRKSKILTVDEAIKIHLSELQNDDPFIYLSSIKGLTSLVEFKTDQALPALLNIYKQGANHQDFSSSFSASLGKKSKNLNKNSRDEFEFDIDAKLKIGEVLNNFIQKFETDPAYSSVPNRHDSLLFKPEHTRLIASTMINMVKWRPADEGASENNSNNDTATVNTKTNPQELNKLVKNHDSLRLSSVSILSTCFRASLPTMLEYLHDILDLVLGIQTFERKASTEETAIRRASIRLAFDIVSSDVVDLSRFPKGYGKRILALLKSMQENDADLLVREQAGDTLAHLRLILLV